MSVCVCVRAKLEGGGYCRAASQFAVKRNLGAYKMIFY